ncbi:MAG: LytTR family DNA-binding domain-containing protein [Clostridiales bacterium]|nr:LytTR family DNA-binding domain-containing protein [Clostridiales bacterium]
MEGKWQNAMLSIAICDPNEAHRAALKDALTKLLFDTIEFRFSCFSSGEALLTAAKGTARFQLLFLEIHLPGISGLETAGQIRAFSPEMDIIFITAAAEYGMVGYRYHAFDFLVKPVSLSMLQGVIERYLEERTQRPADFLRVEIHRNSVQIPLQQILYLESSRRKIVAHLWEENREFYGKLDHLDQILSGSGFIHCHQSFLLNSRYIRQLNSTSVQMANQIELPVSRTYLQAVRTTLGITNSPGEAEQQKTYLCEKE